MYLGANDQSNPLHTSSVSDRADLSCVLLCVKQMLRTSGCSIRANACAESNICLAQESIPRSEPMSQEEISDAHARADVLARVCALYGKSEDQVLEPLRRRLGQMHTHVYLPRRSRERAMALLVALETYAQVRYLPLALLIALER